MTSPHGLISEEELGELDSFLLSEACDEALAVDEAHGYLTALIAGPSQAQAAEWMGAIWGQPRFEDEAQRQRMTELLNRMYDDIVATLEEGFDFEPLAIEIEEEGELLEAYEGWCFGFMLGVGHDEEAWAVLPKEEQPLLAPISQLALLHGDEEIEMDDEEYTAWVELLPGAVLGLYSYFHPRQK
ncbi:MAG TPA: YecA family protein [Gammaproteobacteria bacterium]